MGDQIFTSDQQLRAFAAVIFEIRCLLGQYLTTDPTKDKRVCKAAYLAYAFHNQAQDVLDGKQANLACALVDLSGFDRLLESDLTSRIETELRISKKQGRQNPPIITPVPSTLQENHTSHPLVDSKPTNPRTTDNRIVEVSVYWADDEHTCTISGQTWDRILEGEEVLVEEPYWYEGQEYTGAWYFNHSGPGALRVGYDDGGTGFEGELSDAQITVNGEDWPLDQNQEEKAPPDHKFGSEAFKMAINEENGYCAGNGVEYGIKLIRASVLDGADDWSIWYVTMSNNMNPKDFSCWVEEVGGIKGIKRLWDEHSSPN